MAAVSRSLVFRKAARQEFDAAADWYERERPGLGASFLHEVEALLRLAAENPAIFQIVLGDVRRAVCRRFPYCVFFRVRGDHIVVLSVFPAVRNPKIWRQRV